MIDIFIYFFVEGQTEQTFATNILRPHLEKFQVYVAEPTLIAHARGKEHRGGGRKYAPMKADIMRRMAGQKKRNEFFTTMIDLYAIPTDFPGLDQAEKVRYLPRKRVEILEQAFMEDVDDPRFIPHIQLHEYEAYLFSDPVKFSSFYNDSRGLSRLVDIANKDGKDTPELINDGPNTAPSKRIASVFPDYVDAKTVVGILVAEEIGLSTIRNRCPHFAAWLSRLEQLSTEACR